MLKISGLILVTAFALAARAETTNNGTVAAPAPAGPALSDEQIAKVLLTVNEGEIDAAEIAKHHAKAAPVKDFAKMMIDEHKQNKKDTKEVVKATHFKYKESDLSESLEKQAKNENKQLKKANKADFDSAYLAQQIKMHQDALSLIHNTLIPNAKSAELKAHLAKTETAVRTHLEHAQTLQTQIQ